MHQLHQACNGISSTPTDASLSREYSIGAQVALHYKLCKPRQLHMNLAEVLRAHLELPHAILPGPINYAKAAGELRAFMSVKQLPVGCTLFTQVTLFLLSSYFFSFFSYFPFCVDVFMNDMCLAVVVIFEVV